MKEWIARRPWIWIVLLGVFYVGANLVMMFIALHNAPKLLI